MITTFKKLMILVILSFPLAVSAQLRDGSCGWGPMMGWGGGMFSILGGFFMLLFWIIIIGSIVYLVRHMLGQAGRASSQEAERILKNRYAKGEISKEEYQKMKEDLE